MQYKMTADGAAVSGLIRISSKNKLLDIQGDYNAVFKVEGTLDKKLQKDVFDRYLVNVGKAIAASWLKYEAKAISNFTKAMNSAEKKLQKKAQKMSQSELKGEVDKQQADFKRQAESEFKSQMDKFVGAAHAAALKAMDNTAKAVLKDKKKLILRGVKIVVGLAVAIGATVVAAPVGAVLIAAAVASCIGAAATAAQDGIKLANEFIGNYKSYNKCLGELDKKIDETIKFARACEAKRDRLLVQKAQVEMHMEQIKKEDPGAAIRGSSEVKTTEAQLKSLNASLERMSDYSVKDVERSLTDVRAKVKDLLGDPYLERGTKASENLGKFAKVAGVAAKGLTKLGKELAKAKA